MSAEVLETQAQQTSASTPGGRTQSWRSFGRWESALVILLIATIIFGTLESSEFLSWTTVFYMGINTGQIALMALPLTLIVVTGEIDLSVAAMLGLSATVFGDVFGHGVDVYLAMLVALAVGAIGGSLNGFLVTRLSLPSIAVTIGTLTMFRGIAEVILGQNEVTGFPTGLTVIGVEPLVAHLAYPFVFFLVLAAIYAVILHMTPLGRALFAIGDNEEAAFFSGVRVKRIKFLLYVTSGIVCAAVGIIYALQNAAARYDAGTGLELNVVAVVLFGGISIFGGRGTIIGVVLSVLIVGFFTSALTLINVSAEEQNIVFGVLLLASVLVPNGADGYRRLRTRVQRGRSRSAGPSAGPSGPNPFTNSSTTPQEEM